MTPASQQVQQQVQNYAAHTTITAETMKLEQLGPAVQAGLDAGADAAEPGPVYPSK